MRSLGRILREERERRGLSLDELVKRTRISRTSLHALEQDNPDGFGSIFYFRSFARQVASELGIDQNSKDWLEAMTGVRHAMPPTKPASLEPSYIPRVPPLRARRESGWRTASPVLSFIVVLIACSALYTAADKFDFAGVVSLQQAGRSISGALSTGPSSQPTVPEGGVPQQTSAANTPAPRRYVADEVISIKIAAVETTWLSVDTDGKHIYSGVLGASDTKELEGRSTAKLKTGNAGGLTVTFNGKELGTLGQRGQVRTVLFTRDQYRILSPSLTSRLQLLPAMSLPRWSR